MQKYQHFKIPGRVSLLSLISRKWESITIQEHFFNRTIAINVLTPTCVTKHWQTHFMV